MFAAIAVIRTDRTTAPEQVGGRREVLMVSDPIVLDINEVDTFTASADAATGVTAVKTGGRGIEVALAGAHIRGPDLRATGRHIGMHLLDNGEGVQLVHELFLDRDFLEIGGLDHIVEIKVGKLFAGLALELGFFGKLAFALGGIVLRLEQWLDFESVLASIVREQLA